MAGISILHGPSWGDRDVTPWLGHRDLVDELAQRILHSRGGAFLVTGFRGAGKTTVVRQAIREVTSAIGGATRILPIYITLARPVAPAELLFVVVRQIYEQLDIDGTLQRLPKRTQKLIQTAFVRTSLAVKETRASAMERGVALGLAGGAQALHGLAPKIDLTQKRSRSESTEAAYLTSSEVDVEYDLLRILQVLSDPQARRSWRPWKHRRPSCIHPIVVLDEVDKLTALQTDGTNGMQQLEQLIGALKNVLTSRNVHFIVVAGVDLHDQVIRDTSRGIGVYESVFAWQLYVPCMWHAPDMLLNMIVQDRSPHEDSLEQLGGFLRYRARGVPRRLWQEVNHIVRWDGGHPWLDIGADGDLVIFYSRLEQILSEFLTRRVQVDLFPGPLDMDRWVLSSFYSMDRILRTNGRSFTAVDVVNNPDEPDFDPILRVTTALATPLLQFLTTRNVVAVVRSARTASSTMIGDLQDANLTVYKLVDDVRAVIAGFAHEHHGEPPQEHAERPAAPDSQITLTRLRPSAYGAAEPEPEVVAGLARPPSEPIEVIAGRYLLRRLLGSGGVGSVYEAEDSLLQRVVAIKMLDPWALRDESAKTRFLREGRVASMLNHPNIVRTYDVVDIDSERIAIVMELVPGPTLSEVVRGNGIPAPRAVSTALDLLSALTECQRIGVSRIDLKPSNVIIRNGETAVVIDLGLARRTVVDDEVTMDGVLIGTPAYMAPEQITESESVDIRTDIYCVGLILIECITGTPPRSGDMEEIITQILLKDLDLDALPVSTLLREAISRATARAPSERFQTPEEFVTALLAAPEGIPTMTEAN